MTLHSPDPRRLDVARFAADAGELDGAWPVAELPRLADSECPPDAAGDGTPRAAAEPQRQVRWRAVGSTRVVGGEAQPWLALTASATVVLQCQRCLQPMDEAVHVDRHFRFVRDEATAAALDEEIEDEVLELPRALDLRELVEDEMLLALPLVPRHAQCPQPLPRSFGDVEEVEQAEQKANPFAALAALKKGGAGESH
jgi:uncharacterized protein